MKDEGKIGAKIPLTQWQWKIFRDFGEALFDCGPRAQATAPSRKTITRVK